MWQKMEILPISELGLALHKFVNKDDKLAFTECLQETLDDTQVHPCCNCIQRHSSVTAPSLLELLQISTFKVISLRAGFLLTAGRPESGKAVESLDCKSVGESLSIEILAMFELI